MKLTDRLSKIFRKKKSGQSSDSPAAVIFAFFVVVFAAWIIGLNMKYGVEMLVYRDLRDELYYLQHKYLTVKQNNPELLKQLMEKFPYLRNYDMLNGVLRVVMPITRDLAHIECYMPAGKCLTKRHAPFSNDQYILLFDLEGAPSQKNPRCIYKNSPEGDTLFVRIFLKRPLSFCH